MQWEDMVQLGDLSQVHRLALAVVQIGVPRRRRRLQLQLRRGLQSVLVPRATLGGREGGSLRQAPLRASPASCSSSCEHGGPRCEGQRSR